MKYRFGPDYPHETYIAHGYVEHSVDLGEAVLNYAVTGPETAPALLLIPSQTESWWGYEPVMRLLENSFRVYAVDLRGQGRSSRTPGRYTLDVLGNDLVRFLQMVVHAPAIVAGMSSGGVLSCWLSAYAPPGLVRAAYYEDPPLFSSEVDPAYGYSMHQGGIGLMFALFTKFLGDQWSVGDWQGMLAAASATLPPWLLQFAPLPAEPPQNMKEYDPEWARAFWSGTASAGCDHRSMLKSVKVPVLFTHHFRRDDPETGTLLGAISDLQARRAKFLIESAGQPFQYVSLPEMDHSMHGRDPALYCSILTDWIRSLE